MWKQFYPCWYVQDVFEIDYEKLYRRGFRGIMFDIDNTLVHHGDDSTPRIDGLFRDLNRMGFKTLMLSNNSEERIKRFLRHIDAQYVSDADKPKPDGYLRGIELLGMPKEQIVVVGDQMFTDILGANRVGLSSILVHFIQLPGETKIGKKRYLEKVLLRCCQRNRRSGAQLLEMRKKGSM